MQIATCQVKYAKQAVGMCKFCKQRAANAFVNLDLFHSFHDYFLQDHAIKSMKCQHNPEEVGSD